MDLRDPDVKVYKRRCRNLITRCEILRNGLREGDLALSADHQAALHEAEGILESIRGRVLKWTHLNTARSLLEQDAICNGLDEYDRKIDACIATYNIKIGQKLAQAREQHIFDAQRDISEIRGMMQDLLEEFTRYKKNPTFDVSRTNLTFRTVVQDIEEETRESSLHGVVSEVNDIRTQSSTLSDTFHRQMSLFSKSLVNLELATLYVDGNASERSPRRVRVPNRRDQTDSPSELTQSVGYQRSSNVSPSCPRLPLPNLGPNFTYPAVDETTLTEHSLTSDYPSPSRSTSAVSGSSSRVSTQDSWDSCSSSVITAHRGTAYSSLPVSWFQQPKRPSTIVNDVASGSQSLQRFSLIVPETVWNPGGLLNAIKQQTLESMIQYLIHSAENDNGQRSIFFIALSAFVTPLHVLRILTDRYEEAFLIQQVTERVDTQARILHFLNDWLDNEHVIFDDDILGKMREFLASIDGPESEELDDLILEISRGIREKDYRRPRASLMDSHFQQTQREHPAPRDLAIALAVLEGERYRRIVASEYMACVIGMQPYCPNLSAAIGLNQLISKWVRSCILDRSLGKGRDGIAARSKMKQYFVKTAKECWKIRNFSSSGAIISGLQSEVITRLTATQGGMSIPTTWTFGNLQQNFGKQCNYEAYRKALKNQQKCSIPWHVVDLEDIQAVMEGDADTDEKNDTPQSHLARWARLKRRAMSALHYHVPFTEEDARKMAKEYLITGLQRVLEENLDQEQISLILKAEEDMVVFKKAGFSPQ